jgi:hypothetical protein
MSGSQRVGLSAADSRWARGAGQTVQERRRARKGAAGAARRARRGCAAAGRLPGRHPPQSPSPWSPACSTCGKKARGQDGNDRVGASRALEHCGRSLHTSAVGGTPSVCACLYCCVCMPQRSKMALWLAQEGVGISTSLGPA